jgi:hypothetical protein
MKKVLDDCLGEAVRIGEVGSYNYVECDELVQRYRVNGVQHRQMEQFEAVLLRYRLLVKMDYKVVSHNYMQFSRNCEEYPEIGKNGDIRKLREQYFYKKHEEYLKTKNDSLGEALIAEGSYLMKRGTTPKDVISKLMDVANKYGGSRAVVEYASE